MNNLKKDENGKFLLMDNLNGEIVKFDYAVDAKEALAIRVDDKLRYSIPEVKQPEYIKPQPKHPNEDVEKMQAEQVETYKPKTSEVKIVTKRPGRPPKQVEDAPEVEADEETVG